MSIFRALPGNEPATLAWAFAGLTDTGRTRSHNEDAIAFDPVPGFAIVADGMGGHNGGEAASGMAVASLKQCFDDALARTSVTASWRASHRFLQAGVDRANRAIYEAGRANAHLQGMGTTLVLAAFDSSRVVIGHIGDSRCYRLRAGQLEMLTRDHSLVRQQLDAGHITQEQADRSPARNMVTRALGIEPAVVLEMHDHQAQADDLFLLCSDGLNDMIKNDEICNLLSFKWGLSETAALLVAVANQNGGRDNISVVLVKAYDVTPPNFACPR